MSNATAGKAGYDVEAEVLRRYAAGAERAEPSLCCPSPVDLTYTKLIPKEILEKDYGCGDPAKYAGAGETVVDLGSGAGKACYILAQRVGAQGRVIGVDFNDAMLALARKYQAPMADTLGYGNVSFVKAKIQDLALGLDAAQGWLDAHPVKTPEDVRAYAEACDRLRAESPLIPAGAADLVVSNCVLNLVRPDDKKQLFAEIHRVLKRGGRAVISDVVSDEDPTPEILANPELWSDCIAGAFREDRFLKMFEEAGFYGVEILERQEQPWRVIDGIEFRSVTVRAFKGKEGPCLERNQAVVYKGPWKSVRDDDGHAYFRGERMAVCDKTYRLLTSENGPYAGQFVGLLPYAEIPMDEAKPFDCAKDALRPPKATKGENYAETTASGDSCCGPECC